MKKFITTITALMLTVFLAFAFNGCKPDPDPNPEENMPTKEGVYLGIIGFNDVVICKDLALLDGSSVEDYHSFINSLETGTYTGLYYADYVAINKLASYGEPPKLSKVALVTFTDGLDNASIADNSLNPEQHDSKMEYLSSLNAKIENEVKVYGKDITAYTIGVQSKDFEHNPEEFNKNMTMLASDTENSYLVKDMNEVLGVFEKIASELHSQTLKSKFQVKIPGGYDTGIKVMLTFDNVSDAEASEKRIEATYVRKSGVIWLEDIDYKGFKCGTKSMESTADGVSRVLEFLDIFHEDGMALSNDDLKYLKLWYTVGSGGWQEETEFIKDDPDNQVIHEMSSALIMLVLDCTESLGKEFSTLKTAAKNFVETLFFTTSGLGGNDSGHKYVDLGLSVKWATCNVGANKPEEYGNYYAWGETITKSSYTFGNSKTYNKEMTDITGNVNYDAARANWGGSWRMPTKAEMQELEDRCTWTWTIQNGVKGYKVKGPSGTSIFLPAAGRRYESSLTHAGSGNYWSSTPYVDFDNYSAYDLNSSNYSHFINRSDRIFGQSVRPVIE